MGLGGEGVPVILIFFVIVIVIVGGVVGGLLGAKGGHDMSWVLSLPLPPVFLLKEGREEGCCNCSNLQTP